MPEFVRPWVLLLALLVPLLVWWWLRQRRGALRFPDAESFAHLPSRRAAFARYGGAVLRGFTILLVIVALSGPRWPDRRTRIPTEGIALVMAVDVSGSMAEADYEWEGDPVTRLEAVKRAFRLFVQGGPGPDGAGLQGRSGDLIGLVTFASRPESPCPLTLSHSVLLDMLDAQRPRHIPGEAQTNISDAIVLGLHRLESSGPRRKVLVLLSDGEHNVPTPGSEWTPRQAAQIAANLGVPIYTIDAEGLGSQGNVPAGMPDGHKTLQDIANITHGRAFEAHDTKGLLSVCEEIDRLERVQIQSFHYRRYHEGFVWFGLGSFVVWVLTALLEMTVWRRLP